MIWTKLIVDIPHNTTVVLFLHFALGYPNKHLARICVGLTWIHNYCKLLALQAIPQNTVSLKLSLYDPYDQCLYKNPLQN